MPPKGTKKTKAAAPKEAAGEADYSGLSIGMRVQGEWDGTYYACEVMEVSKAKKRAKAPVKVHFMGYEASDDKWLGADSIRSKAIVKSGAAPTKAAAKAKAPAKGAKTKEEPVTYDYSGLEPGMRLQAEQDGVYYAAEVVQVSTAAKKKKAPVKVHFMGYDPSEDVWLGGESIRSKALTKGKAAAPKAKAEKKEPKAKKGDAKKDTKEKKPREPIEVEMGYWAIRGLGAVVRMILEYREVKYTDKQFKITGEDWFKEAKPKILEMNPLANLPYIVVGKDCICQSNSVLSYLGSRLGLGGRGYKGRIMNEQLVNEIYDVRNTMMETVYVFKKVNRTEKEFKESAEKLVGEPPFSKFEAWLEKGETDYFCGKTPCTSDFHIWEMMDQTTLLAKKMGKGDPIEKFPKCKAFYDRFRELPTLKKYFESDSYKLPINNSAAPGGCHFY